MAHVERAIEVARPLEDVAAHLEEFPSVRSRVDEVEPAAPDAVRVHEGGAVREVRVERVAGADAVAFHDLGGNGDEWRLELIALSPKRTRVDLVVRHDPAGLIERAEGALGVLERRVEADLTAFKAHVEGATPPPG